jgi:hypothetical protein
MAGLQDGRVIGWQGFRMIGLRRIDFSVEDISANG